MIVRVRRDFADLASAYHRFWFAPAAPHALAALRVLAGGMMLYSTAVWGLALEEFFGPRGYQPPGFARETGAGPSLWFLVPPGWARPFHYGCLAVLAAFTLGAATPATAVLSFLIVTGYAQRVPAATFGLDQIVSFLALYLAVAPSGAVYSLDALLRGSRPAATVRAGTATRLIQVHLCVLYAAAGLAKLKGTSWWDGSAIWRAAANLEYQSLDLTWLAWAEPLANLLTHFTVAWELSFWALVWNPRLRPYVLAAGTGMHLGIGAFLGMWTFGLAVTFAYLAFAPPAFVRQFVRLLVGRAVRRDRKGG